MKRLLLLICLVVFSCSTDSTDSNDGDNVNEPTLAELLIGEWSSARYVLEEDGENIIDVLSNECTSQTTFIFLENGNYSYAGYGGTSLANCSGGTPRNGTYTLTGNILSLSEFEDDLTVQIANNTIIMTDPVCDNNECDGLNIWYYNRVN